MLGVGAVLLMRALVIVGATPGWPITLLRVRKLLLLGRLLLVVSTVWGIPTMVLLLMGITLLMLMLVGIPRLLLMGIPGLMLMGIPRLLVSMRCHRLLLVLLLLLPPRLVEWAAFRLALVTASTQR